MSRWIELKDPVRLVLVMAEDVDLDTSRRGPGLLRGHLGAWGII